MAACVGVAGRTTAAAAGTIVGDTVHLRGNGSPGPYWLSGFFILSHSERVIVDGRILQRDRDYTVDCNRGLIGFSHPLLPGDSAVVCFQRLSFALPSRWLVDGYRSPDAAVSAQNLQGPEIVPVAYEEQGVSRSFRAPPWNPRRDGLQQEIRWEGFKSLAFTAADRGERSWSQGLELTVRGDLAPGVQLSAAVSDRAVAGLNGERSSADGLRLGTVDRLFIEARSARFYGRWGELTLTDQAPGMVSRRATGVQARWRSQTHAVSGAIAHPHGEWRRRRIALQPDVSGPYRVAETPGWAGVVPGSIALWLDGERLEEGEGHDYTVDWTRGTVTLAPRRRIGSQSTLVVEFEQTLDAYARTLAGSQWSWSNALGDRKQVLSLQWEGDDPSTPLFGDELTQAQRDRLTHDPSGRLRTSTAERVAPDQGDYRLDVFDGGDSVFTYVGPGRGDWRVRFRWVGAGNGRYRHLADEAYDYVGKGAGDYDASAELNAPTARLGISESLCLPVGKMGRFSADWTGTAVDRNRLASGATTLLSDHRLGFLFGRPDAQDSRKLEVSWCRNGGGDAWRQARGSGDLARLTDVWGLRSSLTDSTFDEYNCAAILPLGRGNAVRAAAGYWSGGRVSAWRRFMGVTLVPRTGLRSDLRWDHRDARLSRDVVSGRRDSYLSTLEWTRPWGTVGAGWQKNECRDTSGVFEAFGRYVVSRWMLMSVRGIELRHTWETARDSSVADTRRSRELSVSCPMTLLGGLRGGELAAARGTRSSGSGACQPYYRGRLRGRWEPSRSCDVRVDMALSQQQAGVQRERFLPTRPGEGQYRYERGEYVPDPRGDFRRVLVDATGDQTAAYQGDKHLVFSWWPAWGRWRWSLNLEREVHGRYRSAAFSPAEWIAPWTSVASSLLTGSELVVHDAHRVSVRPSERTEIIATIGRERTALSLVDGGGDDAVSHTRRAGGRLRQELGEGIFIESAAEYQRRERRGAATELDADGRTLQLVFGQDSRRGIGVALESRRRVDREFRRGHHVVMWGVAPRTQVRIAAVAVSVRADFTWVNTDVAASSLSPLMVEGRPRGFSATESAELRWQLPGRVTLNLRAYGDHRIDEPDRWRVDIESVVRL